jgi:hypothetical protein
LNILVQSQEGFIERKPMVVVKEQTCIASHALQEDFVRLWKRDAMRFFEGLDICLGTRSQLGLADDVDGEQTL